MIELKNITKKYINKNNTVIGINNVSLSLPSSGFIAVLGASGCGKTTLLNILGSIDTPDSGKYYFDNELLDFRKKEALQNFRCDIVTTVFQEDHLCNNSSVLENISIVTGIQKEADIDYIFKILEKVELKGKEHNRIHELSGGQKQRVNIARSATRESRVFIADEPTGNLDEKTELLIFRMLNEMSKDKLVILVTHNRNIANTYCDRIIELKDGEIIYDLENVKNSKVSDLKIENDTISIRQDNAFHVDDWIIIKKLLFEKKELKLILNESETKDINRPKIRALPNSREKKHDGNAIWKKVFYDNLKFYWKSHLVIAFLLSLIVSLAITSHQISQFNESSFILETLEKNNSNGISFRRDSQLNPDFIWDGMIGETELNVIKGLENSKLMDYFFDFELYSPPIEASKFFGGYMTGLSYSSYENFDILYGNIDSRGVLITDFTLRELLRYGIYGDVSDIVGNYIPFGSIDLLVTGVINTDFERFGELANYFEKHEKFPPHIERLIKDFKFQRHTVYSRLHLVYPVGENRIINNFIIGPWEVRATLISFDQNTDLEFTSFGEGSGVYVSEGLHNILSKEYGEISFIGYRDTKHRVIGYVKDGRIDDYMIYAFEEIFSKIENSYFLPNQVLVKEFDYNIINHFVTGGHSHTSPVSLVVNEISFVFNSIKTVFVYVLLVLIVMFSLLSTYSIHSLLSKRNRKTGILSVFGIRLSDFYKSNILEFLLMGVIVSGISFSLNSLFRHVMNHQIAADWGIATKAIQFLPLVLIYTPVITSTILVVIVLMTTKLQLQKSISTLMDYN